jgi:hypothetical protein
LPKFRDGFVDVLVDARRVNDARIVAQILAFKKNGPSGVQVFESADQIPNVPRYVWLNGLSYIEPDAFNQFRSIQDAEDAFSALT